MIVQFTGQHKYDGDSIELFWKMYRLVHELHDHPVVWKLDTALLEHLAHFLCADSIEVVLTMNFLDASVDRTSKAPALLCVEQTYPFSLVTH
ncbi:MAG: hypothetical protein JSS66_05400 [Armatimonadetes bacterium]|nr:hypothetical protein [Armatimonadota bacterium]